MTFLRRFARRPVLPLLAAVPLVLLPAAPAHADVDAGLVALDRRDYATAIRTLLESTAGGDPRAAAALADIHERGLGVPRDDAQALRWRRIAAGQGDAESAFRIGNRYARGDGVPRDEAVARDWYRKAATRGHPAAQLELSKLLGAAGASDADARESATWFERAKANGAAVAPVFAPPAPAVAEVVPTQTDLRHARRHRERAARLHAIAPFPMLPVPVRTGPAGNVVWVQPVPGIGAYSGFAPWWIGGDPIDPGWAARGGLPPTRW